MTKLILTSSISVADIAGVLVEGKHSYRSSFLRLIVCFSPTICLIVGNRPLQRLALNNREVYLRTEALASMHIRPRARDAERYFSTIANEM